MTCANNRFIESYFFGVNNSQIQVNQTALVGTSLYAATEEGLYKARPMIQISYWKALGAKLQRVSGNPSALINNVILGCSIGSQSAFVMD